MATRALALLLLLLGSSCAADRAPRQVIFILLDAARADRISAYGYSRPTTPNLDRLAADGLLFRNHFAQGTMTTETMPPLLFSRYFVPPLFPASSSVPLENPHDLFRGLDEESRSLPRILSDAGIRTVGISAHLWIHEGTRIADEFDELRGVEVSSAAQEAGLPYAEADQVVDEALVFLEEAHGQDFFLYLHFMDTHFPHPFRVDAGRLFGSELELPPGMTPEGRPLSALSPITPAQADYVNAVYDGDLAYTDREIGRLIRFLDSRGRRDDTLIVVTADHGEHLLEVPGRFEHGGPWLDAVARVPWIVSLPSRLAPGTIDALTESVDVLPTVLGLLDLPLPAGISPDGSDILAPGHDPEGPVFAAKGMRDRRFKIVFHPDTPSLRSAGPLDLSEIEGQLYDLSRDPLEEEDLWSEKPEVVRELLNTYRARMVHRYERFVAAGADHRPTRAFAIATYNFDLHDSVRKAPPGLSSIPCSTLGSDWFLEAAWWDPMLVAGPEAGPGWIRFPVPDGPYRLQAAVRGDGWIQPHGQASETRMSGPEFLPSAPINLGEDWGTDEVNLGIIEVTNSTFYADVRPEPGSCLLVRRLGFAPISPGSEMSEADREKLRSLGYVN